MDFAHAVIPGLVKSWTQEDFDRAEDRAAIEAGFSWKDADVLGSVTKTRAPILYFSSPKDHWIPPENMQKLAAATTSTHKVGTMNFSGTNGMEEHVLVSWVIDPIGPPVVEWFHKYLEPGRLLVAGAEK